MLTFLRIGALTPLFVLLASCASEVEFAAGPSTAEQQADATAVPPPATPEPELQTVEREFPAARTEPMSVTYQPEFRRAAQDITMTELAPASQTLTQTTRQAGSDSFRQGKDAQTFGPETFPISNAGKLDLLVVVDDSTSMADEQTNLATKLDPLLSQIANTDWQIAVVTTSNPCLRNGGRPIRKGDANADAAFQAAVIVPLDNTVVEKGFPMAIKALKGECGAVTTPWLRSGSSVGVLILSDEDNCGSHAGEGCPGEAGETTQQMVDFLTGSSGIRAVGMARIYGIIDAQDTCGSSAFPAPKYKAGIDATGGTWGRICDADYTTALRAISTNVSRIVRRDFTLTHVPDSGTLNISVDGNAPASGYSINGKVLTLSSDDASRVNLSVTYSYGAVPKFNRFRLGMAADPMTIAVKINNVVESPANYSYDDATQEIVFMNLPVDDATIVATYRRDVVLPTRFPLVATDVLGAPLKVEVGGVETTAYTFDPATTAVELATAPTDGVPVRVTYRSRAGRVTRYAAALADPSDAFAVTAVDALTDEPLDASLAASGDVVFQADDVVAGRVVKVAYELGYDPQDLQILLSHAPVGGLVEVKTATSGTACADVRVDDRTVSFSCPDQDVGSVTFDYRAATETFDAFTLADEIPAEATWKVYVDGVELADFAREGNTVRLPASSLTPESVVKIAATFPRR